MSKIKLIDDFAPRSYQENIFANSLGKNSLVILPTGLGKTVVAIMLSVFYFNQFNGSKKVLFLAPTKPLVEQQEKSFKGFFSNSDEFKFKVLTGMVSPKKREVFYKENDFIFSTPQLIENDIVNRIISPEDFCLVILDEAHRGVGNYAYTFIAEQFDIAKSKILALTASPGTSKEQVILIMDTLKLSHIEVKKFDDSDVKPYMQKTEVKKVKIELSEEILEVRKLLYKVFEKRVEFLQELGFLQGKKVGMITKTDLLSLQVFIRQEIAKGDADQDLWKAVSLAAGIMKLQYGIELFESQEISAAHVYFHNFFRDGGDKTKAAEELCQDYDFRKAYEKISSLYSNGVKHPKLLKLLEIVTKEVIANKDLRIIVFSQYRETAGRIVSELSQIKELKPTIFVGQAKKGDVNMSQKEQKLVLDKFRSGEFNILVSTSVGEEGLDIPKVDMVVFYEPVASAIRTIQRIGRTGRFKAGKAYVLMSDGTRDVVTSHIANAKEKKMYRVLDSIKEEITKRNDENNNGNGLNKFIKMENNNVVGNVVNNVNNSGNLNDNVNYKNQDKNCNFGKYGTDKVEIKSIIFDYGNVLNEFGKLKQIYDFLKENHSGKIIFSSDDWMKKVKNFWIDSELGKDNGEGFFQASAELFEEEFEFHKEKIEAIMLKINFKMLDIVKRLKEEGKIVAILSNNIGDIIDKYLDMNDIRDFFDEVIDSSKVGMKKPNKDIYEFTLDLLNLEGKECLFVDDKVKNLEASHHFGMHSYCFDGNVDKFEEFLIEKRILKDPKSIITGKDDRILIYVDSRENNDLIKELFALDEIKVEAKKLDVGDIVINDKIAIERKTKKDFVDSIVDRRLFPQLINLAKSYRRPVLIVEGEENIFGIRNLHANVIRSTLSAIAIDLRMPILFTSSMQETAQMVRTIAKRTMKAKKDISLVTDKMSFSDNQEMEKFISTIPRVNVVSAKSLLKHFGSVKSLIQASEEELFSCEGIGKVRAKNLKEFFEREYKTN